MDSQLQKILPSESLTLTELTFFSFLPFLNFSAFRISKLVHLHWSNLVWVLIE